MVCSWSSSSPFANHYTAPFKPDNKDYNCVEQYLMYHKAITLMTQQRRYSQPRKQVYTKHYGRRAHALMERFGVKWKEILHEKRTSCQIHTEQGRTRKLLSTGTKELVEAGPHWEKIWGAGLRLHDKDITVKEKWNGKICWGPCLVRLEMN